MKDCTINQHVDGDGNAFSGSGDVQSNSFASHGGQMNIAQGANSIGQQINYYGSQPPPPVIPRQIPAPEPCFLHRKEELVWLNERLHPGKVAAVCGPGGMGKSALAAQAVSKLEAGRFPDGIIFHSFYHQPKIETALQAICQAFQVEAKTSLESTVRQVLSGRKALLILDGAEVVENLKAVLDLRSTCGVLITSRKRTDALADRLDLKPLDEQPAAEVFRLYSGIAADDPSVAGICTLLGGWPVALRIAGRYISSTGESAADYLRWLAKKPFRKLKAGKNQEDNIALLLERSVAQVREDAVQVLRLAGVLAFAPISLGPVAAVLSKENEDQDDLELRSSEALGELVAYGLLEKHEERWQTSHALIHTYARTELAMSKESLERLARLYIRTCHAASVAGIDGYAFLDGERAHCLRLMESCFASELWQAVTALVGAIWEYLDRQGHWTDQLTAIGMNLTAARQAGDRKDEGWCLNNLGYTCHRRGERESALGWYEQSLPIYRELQDRESEGLILNNIGNIYREQGNDEQALKYFQQSLSIQREIGNREGEGATLISIGVLYNAQGDKETALQQYEQALPIWQKAGDKSREGATLNNIAAIYRAQGDYAKAIEYREQALVICQQIGEKSDEAQIRWNIGITYGDIGNLAKVEEHISLAVQIAKQIGLPALDEWRKNVARVRAARQG